MSRVGEKEAEKPVTKGDRVVKQWGNTHVYLVVISQISRAKSAGRVLLASLISAWTNTDCLAIEERDSFWTCDRKWTDKTMSF